MAYQSKHRRIGLLFYKYEYLDISILGCKSIFKKSTISTYSLHPTKTVRLAFKFYLTKSVILDYSKVHLIKTISNTKK
jgi:hypothetical protein